MIRRLEVLVGVVAGLLLLAGVCVWLFSPPVVGSARAVPETPVVLAEMQGSGDDWWDVHLEGGSQTLTYEVQSRGPAALSLTLTRQHAGQEELVACVPATRSGSGCSYLKLEAGSYRLRVEARCCEWRLEFSELRIAASGAPEYD